MQPITTITIAIIFKNVFMSSYFELLLILFLNFQLTMMLNGAGTTSIMMRKSL